LLLSIVKVRNGGNKRGSIAYVVEILARIKHIAPSSKLSSSVLYYGWIRAMLTIPIL
jgi:hypothetical protein